MAAASGRARTLSLTGELQWQEKKKEKEKEKEKRVKERERNDRSLDKERMNRSEEAGEKRAGLVDAAGAATRGTGTAVPTFVAFAGRSS